MTKQQKLRQMADQIESGFGLQKGTVVPTNRQRMERKREQKETGPKPYSDMDYSYWNHQIK